MTTQADLRRYRENLQAERDAVALYEQLAAAEPNPGLSAVYRRLIKTEEQHVAFWEAKLREAGAPIPAYVPAWRVRILGWLARRFGPAFVLPTIAGLESSVESQYDHQPEPEAAEMSAHERSHARVFSLLARTTQGLEGPALARFEGRHRAAGGNALRAAVLGANDGLVSVFSLIMGVAGAGVGAREILLTGLAGMLAGGLSMALGEWLSVQSSRELYQHQITIERRELAEMPEEEMAELALIYQAKGLPAEAAQNIAERLLSDPSSALDTLAREELGIDPTDLGGSAWEAAFMSFLLFSLGALVPVFPYLFLSGTAGIVASSALSLIALFVIGAAITLMTGRSVLSSGLRQVGFGLAAAAVTFGVGRLLGVNVIG
ncbi:MAG: demethoxyubiquinone hydroxylase family protein [Anaerolineae bacterium]